LLWRSPFAYLERCRRRYGSRFTIRATGFPPLIFLSDPKDVRALIGAPADVLHPGEGGSTIAPIVGENSFMLLDEDRHLSARKAILPAFHAKVVQQHADLVADVARREIRSWPRDTAIALHPRLRVLTLEVILRKAFGLSGDVADERIQALRDQLLAMLSVASSIVLSEPMLRHGPGGHIWDRFLRRRAAADELIYALIEEHRHAASPGEQDTGTAPMPAEQVRDNLMSIILAGHETTSSELAWACQLLTHHPAVLDRVTAEIDRDTGEAYLTATIQEVLRHRPVFLFAIPRTVKQPIEIGGWTYGQSVQLLGCIYLLHHDPTLYLQPHEFQPERFLDAPPNPHTWLPWGGGRKRCPGLHLAMLEMKTVLRAILSELTMRPVRKEMERPRWRSVIVTPHAGSRVMLHRRG
jgi:cytochrome P450